MEKTMMLQGLLGVAALFIFILGVFCLVLKSRANRYQRDYEDLETQLNSIRPYIVGDFYRGKDGNKSSGDIVVSFDAKLSPVQDENNPSPPVKLITILDRFYKDPAKMLDSFYQEGKPFGITIPVSRLWPSKTKKDTFYIIVKDLSGQEYFLLMEELPEILNYDVKIAGSKK